MLPPRLLVPPVVTPPELMPPEPTPLVVEPPLDGLPPVADVPPVALLPPLLELLPPLPPLPPLPLDSLPPLPPLLAVDELLPPRPPALAWLPPVGLFATESDPEQLAVASTRVSARRDSAAFMKNQPPMSLCPAGGRMCLCISSVKMTYDGNLVRIGLFCETAQHSLCKVGLANR
jgi:hypothetical protein